MTTEVCAQLHELSRGLVRHRFPFDRSAIPANGIYLLFERGEPGHGQDRIVRIGSHTGQGQLPSRLEQHFLTENKDRSIFRKNIGRALLNRDGDPFAVHWELDLTTRAAREQHAGTVDLAYQAQIEADVSRYIQENFSFVVFEVADKNKRLTLESRLISTASLCSDCAPSSGWLGHHSPKAKIRESGLWLVQHLYKTPAGPDEIAALDASMKPICKGERRPAVPASGNGATGMLVPGYSSSRIEKAAAGSRRKRQNSHCSSKPSAKRKV